MVPRSIYRPTAGVALAAAGAIGCARRPDWLWYASRGGSSALTKGGCSPPVQHSSARPERSERWLLTKLIVCILL
uniref:Uncharacterized protein n=1 Tax=Plectus sambesii TaxID=2011161 RepID=A0A914UYF1_9BILA